MTTNQSWLVHSRKNVNQLDSYSTPEYMTESLLKKENFIGKIHEPACGDGKMAKMIEKYYECVSSDISNISYGKPNEDFLLCNSEIDNIITNPPYNISTEFLIHALKITKKKIAFLLRLNFLESKRRYDIFKNSPLKTVYVFSKRQSLFPTGSLKTNSGTIVFAWYVWDKSYSGKPMLDWICD